jgi:hypothetical protein
LKSPLRNLDIFPVDFGALLRGTSETLILLNCLWSKKDERKSQKQDGT